MSLSIDAPGSKRQRPLGMTSHTDFYFPTITPTLCSTLSSSTSDSCSWRSRERIDSVHEPDGIEKSDVLASLSADPDYNSDDSMESITTPSSANENVCLQFANSMSGSIEPTARDNLETLENTSSFQTGKLCKACKNIPLHECLSAPVSKKYDVPWNLDQNRHSLVFCKSLSKILKNRGICKLCKLLSRSVEQPEYDLLKAAHIRDHLSKDAKFRNMASFAEAIKKNSDGDGECVGEAGIWPFGYATNQQQNTITTQLEAKRLFTAAEDRDIKTTSLNSEENMYESNDNNDLKDLCVAQGDSVSPNSINKIDRRLGKIDNTMQIAKEQPSSVQRKRRKRLPCIFMLRVYRKEEEKAGALSVRVYGHGGALLAPLKEICHFSMRFEGDGNPRRFEEQIWYSRKLRDYIDIRFFKQCITACESMHSQEGGCSQLLCEPPPASTLDGPVTLRLVDVRRMRVKLFSFQDFTRPQNPLKYVALSYRWGSPPLREGWVKKDNPNPDVPPSERIYYEHMQTGEQSWDPPGATKLTSYNETFLSMDDSLEHANVYISNTVMDAIEVVARLGQRYLWVDELCTVQSGDDEDKDTNMERMDQILNYALFTVIVADGSHADAGIKGIASRRDVGRQISEDGILKNARMVLPVNIKMRFEQWEERACAFQEKLLSRRLLVFAGGFAMWRCRGGIWREDVNALDGDKASISFPWLRLTSVPQPDTTPFARAGLTTRIIDESVRLTRVPAMEQYIECVEDFSRRTIGGSRDVLNAFRGLSNILTSKSHLNSPMRQGLPSYFFDVALLWKPKEPLKRRQDEFDDESKAIHRAPPSWSWAGWESAEARTYSGVNGGAVHYDVPFDVGAGGTASKTGIVLQICKNRVGEERIRPRKGTFYCLDGARTSLHELGMFSAPGMQTMGFRDWDSWQPAAAPKPNLGNVIPLLDERHLVLQTELTEIIIGEDCWRTSVTRKVDKDEHRTTFFTSADPRSTSSGGISDTAPSHSGVTMEVSHEYWINIPAQKADDPSQQTRATDVKDRKYAPPLLSRVGVLKLDADFHAGSLRTVKAVILSEAQYLGNEPTPDVLGYPLYNIMLVRRVGKFEGHSFAERIGTGKIYKYAWRAAKPVNKVIVLG